MLASCTWRFAPACFKSVWVETHCCKIASEAERFFRIGFLFKEFDFEKRFGEGDEVDLKRFLELAWSGPYSHVTSSSLSLRRVSQ
jgi:hypothetical protein